MKRKMKKKKNYILHMPGFPRRHWPRSRGGRTPSIACRSHLRLRSAVMLLAWKPRVEDKPLTAGVPSTEQVDAAGEEARLEDSQDHSQRGHLVPRLDKAHADHHNSPKQSDQGQVDPRTDPAD